MNNIYWFANTIFDVVKGAGKLKWCVEAVFLIESMKYLAYKRWKYNLKIVCEGFWGHPKKWNISQQAEVPFSFIFQSSDHFYPKARVSSTRFLDNTETSNFPIANYTENLSVLQAFKQPKNPNKIWHCTNTEKLDCAEIIRACLWQDLGSLQILKHILKLYKQNTDSAEDVPYRSELHMFADRLPLRQVSPPILKRSTR